NIKLPQNGVEYATANYNCCMGNNHCSRRLKSNLLEGLALARMQKQRREFSTEIN
ncbi:hypothetical protein L9F63_007550, partial [Diploptera punctata]